MSFSPKCLSYFSPKCLHYSAMIRQGFEGEEIDLNSQAWNETEEMLSRCAYCGCPACHAELFSCFMAYNRMCRGLSPATARLGEDAATRDLYMRYAKSISEDIMRLICNVGPLPEFNVPERPVRERRKRPEWLGRWTRLMDSLAEPLNAFDFTLWLLLSVPHGLTLVVFELLGY